MKDRVNKNVSLLRKCGRKIIEEEKKKLRLIC